MAFYWGCRGYAVWVPVPSALGDNLACLLWDTMLNGVKGQSSCFTPSIVQIWSAHTLHAMNPLWGGGGSCPCAASAIDALEGRGLYVCPCCFYATFQSLFDRKLQFKLPSGTTTNWHFRNISFNLFPCLPSGGTGDGAQGPNYLRYAPGVLERKHMVSVPRLGFLAPGLRCAYLHGVHALCDSLRVCFP